MKTVALRYIEVDDDAEDVDLTDGELRVILAFVDEVDRVIGLGYTPEIVALACARAAEHAALKASDPRRVIEHLLIAADRIDSGQAAAEAEGRQIN